VEVCKFPSTQFSTILSLPELQTGVIEYETDPLKFALKDLAVQCDFKNGALRLDISPEELLQLIDLFKKLTETPAVKTININPSPSPSSSSSSSSAAAVTASPKLQQQQQPVRTDRKISTLIGLIDFFCVYFHSGDRSGKTTNVSCENGVILSWFEFGSISRRHLFINDKKSFHNYRFFYQKHGIGSRSTTFIRSRGKLMERKLIVAEVKRHYLPILFYFCSY
jgi:hypothetical protein